MVLLPRLIGGRLSVSSSEARRLIQQGGVKLDGETVAADILELPREALDWQGSAGRQAAFPQPLRRRRLSLADQAARQTSAGALYSRVLLGLP